MDIQGDIITVTLPWRSIRKQGNSQVVGLVRTCSEGQKWKRSWLRAKERLLPSAAGRPSVGAEGWWGFQALPPHHHLWCRGKYTIWWWQIYLLLVVMLVHEIFCCRLYMVVTRVVWKQPNFRLCYKLGSGNRLSLIIMRGHYTYTVTYPTQQPW